MDYSSGDRLWITYIAACYFRLAKLMPMPMIDVAAAMLLDQRRCYNGTAIAESSGDAVWNVNPTALLMNDVAVASLAYAIVGNSKVISVLRPSISVMKEITHAGRYYGCKTSYR